MTTGSQVAAAAREWLGTPWVHQHRMKGVAVDCAGLVIGVARELHLVEPSFDVNGYSRSPDGSMLEVCERFMTRVTSPEVGDVIVFKFERDPQHLGIAVNYRHGGLAVVHARAQGSGGSVVEHRLAPHLMAQVTRAYRLPGVA